MTVSIDLKNVTLEYPVYDYSHLSLQKTLASLASAGTISQSVKGFINIRSIDNVSLSLKSGDKLAIVGGNGAGKTTLLKVIPGIYAPTQGECIVKGKVTTILGTGYGFDDATGYQNIVLGGIAVGYSRREMEGCIDDIADFSELGEFLSMPIRTYSAGMRARLAFGIATCMRSDIVTIDEGIGAGDANFYEKANLRLQNFLGNASILIIASHANDLLKKFCNKCLYLNHGKVEFFGPLEEGLDFYQSGVRSSQSAGICLESI